MQYVKYYKKTAVIFICTLMFAACSKSFLDVAPQGQTTEDQGKLDPNAAEGLVTATYNTLYLGGFGATTVGFEWSVIGDIASDDADKGSTSSDFDVNGAGDIDNFKVDPNNSVINNIWIGNYTGIGKANYAIDAINNATFDTATKSRLLGEVRFLRGFFYFNLVRTFGPAPLITRFPPLTEINPPEFQVRVSIDSIYAQIINDMQFAVDNLPLKGDAATQLGRANKGVAESFLAKVYLYRKNYQKAYDLSEDVIESKLYSLVPDYSLIFRENPVGGIGGNNNTESIFEVETGVNPSESAVSPLFSNAQGPRGTGGWNDLGFGFNDPSADLINAYETGDKRRDATTIFIRPTASGIDNGCYLWDGYRIPSQDSVQNPRYSYKAYHSPIAESAQQSGSKDNKPKNIRLMRYAEVLLINAEAAANIGKAGEATDNLNLVRERAGLKPSTGTVQNIWKERRVELAMEQDRFFDIVRQGRAGQIMRAVGKNFTDGKNEVFPIPQIQIDKSGGKLIQNNGY